MVTWLLQATNWSVPWLRPSSRFTCSMSLNTSCGTNGRSLRVLCPAHAPCARTMVDCLRDSWKHLLHDQAPRSLSYNDEHSHVKERIKVSQTGQRLHVLLDEECQPAHRRLAGWCLGWLVQDGTVYFQVHILDKDLDAYEKRLEAFSQHLTESDCIFHQNC
jgi:hypothetical protein